MSTLIFCNHILMYLHKIMGIFRDVTFLSKVLERAVHRQMSSYFIVNKLMPEFQSAYRLGHSMRRQYWRYSRTSLMRLTRVNLRYCLFQTSQPHSIPLIIISYNSDCRGLLGLTGLRSSGLIRISLRGHSLCALWVKWLHHDSSFVESHKGLFWDHCFSSYILLILVYY